MVHTCSACHQKYLVSDYTRLCNPCGNQRQELIEHLLDESDRAVEWWRLVAWASGSEDDQGERRWWIG